MKKISNKTISITIVSILIVSVLSTVFLTRMPGEQNKILQTNSTSSQKTASDFAILLPPNSEKISSSKALEKQDSVTNIGVNGNPTKTNNNSNNSSQSITTSSSATGKKAPPSVSVSSESNSTQSKPTPTTNPYPTNPDDWTPPPPGTGSILISEGYESIPISTNQNTEKLQSELGLYVGSKLVEAGYKAIYPDAGTVRPLCESAVKNYAYTGAVTLNAQSYGLPNVIGYYNAKIPIEGINVLEAGKMIADYIKNDIIFNNLISTTFNKYRDGFLSVYQYNGSFYVLFVVVDIKYSN